MSWGDSAVDKMTKTVAIRSLDDPSLGKADLEYWLSRPPEERVAAVDFLRAQFYGTGPQRLQRVARVLQLPRG
jgi:hypothetical protein